MYNARINYSKAEQQAYNFKDIDKYLGKYWIETWKDMCYVFDHFQSQPKGRN